MNKRWIPLALGCAIVFFVACGEDKSEEGNDGHEAHQVNEDENDEDTQDEADRLEFDNLFANVTPPYTMAKLVTDAGLDLDVSMLHNPNKAPTYSTERAQGLNLGIYAADLNYAHLMELGTQEIEFLAAVLSLTEKLGIEKALNQEVIGEMRANIANPDKVMDIITDTYANLEGYLREERREEIAAYMMAGGVVEIIYLATHSSNDDPQLLQAIADQSIGVQSIIEIIYRLGETDRDEIVLQDLNAINAVFNRMQDVPMEDDTDMESEEVTLGGSYRKDLTPELAQELRDLTTEIRGRYIED